jgi:hypothetical protein
MNESLFVNIFRDAESYGFLSVPILVPPMIEEAFGYHGRSQYVALGFGVHGGVMGDLVGNAERPFPPISIGGSYCILPSSHTQMPFGLISTRRRGEVDGHCRVRITKGRF